MEFDGVKIPSQSQLKRPTWDPQTDLPDLSGKVAIVTGVNAEKGIGFQLAHQLALKGAKVYVGARNLTKAENAINIMKRTGGKLDLHPLPVDLGNFVEVREAAQDFLKKEKRLDILVNNAALLLQPAKLDPHGIQESLAISHLGPFVFTTELLPLLRKTAVSHPGVRVVNVSSQAYLLAPTGTTLNSLADFNQDFGGADDMPTMLKRYGLSKLANILFAKELERRFEADGVHAVALSVHPGAVKTDGAVKSISEEMMDSMDPLTPLEGALTPLFAAAHPVVWAERRKYGGAYLMPFGIIEETNENGSNPELAAALWKTSEDVIRGVLDTK